MAMARTTDENRQQQQQQSGEASGSMQSSQRSRDVQQSGLQRGAPPYGLVVGNDPWTTMTSFADEMERMFDDFFGFGRAPLQRRARGRRGWTQPYGTTWLPA